MPNLLVKSLSSKLGFGALVVSFWAAAFAVTFYDAIPALRASYAILHRENFWNPSKNLEESITAQRQIQAHYLSYGVYIPLDDIVIGAHISNTQPLMKSIEGVCGPGATAIWVPVAFHFPIFGEKVFEWCLVRT
ncbi:MAG: hypothetical protein H7318_19940 [Oligoflexus sp.]|nr:hypothetical protein [Oligoflexus sp.]